MKTLFAVCALFAFGSSAAQADVVFCNYYHRTIYAAWAYQKGSDWYSHGWLKLLTGICRPAHLEVSKFYYRGETDWFHVRGSRRMESWGNGPRKFSVTDKRFDFRSADVNRKGARFEKFTVSLQPDKSGHPLDDTVTFKADGTVMQSVVVHGGQ